MDDWRSRMHPTVSRAEEIVFQELSRLHLTGAMVTQKPIVLRQTIPDFFWIEKRKCVYLDGEQAHAGKEELDQEIVDMLEVRGFSVLRITYKPPLSGTRLAEIIGDIREFIGETEEEVET
jgi:very-short-patch-repair endonuclease